MRNIKDILATAKSLREWRDIRRIWEGLCETARDEKEFSYALDHLEIADEAIRADKGLLTILLLGRKA